MKRTPTASSGFSWADEVEREERELAERARATALMAAAVAEEDDDKKAKKRKPNPFGDAKPREVVLEGKGVDWRNLDRALDSRSDLRKDSKLKANISAPGELIGKQASYSRVTKQTEKTKIGIIQSVQPKQHRDTKKLVSPLKYPPKNYTALVDQIRGGRTPNVASLNNCHRSQNPSNLCSEPMHLKSVNSVHGLTRGPENNLMRVEAHDLRMYSNRETVITRELVDSNCKDCNGIFSSARIEMLTNGERVTNIRNSYNNEDGYYHDESQQARNYTNFTCAEDKSQTNRRVLGELNKEITSFNEYCKHGLERHWTSTENAPNNSCIEDVYQFDQKNIADEIQHRRNHLPLKRNHLPLNRRIILGGFSIERNSLSKKYKDGLECQWNNVQDSGRRNHKIQHQLQRHAQQNYGVDNHNLDGSVVVRSLGSTFKVAEFGGKGNDVELVSSSSSKVIEKGGARKGETYSMEEGCEIHNIQKRELQSAATSGPRRRRHRKHGRR